MKNSLETRLGIFFALAIVVAVILIELVGGLDFLKESKRINARFEDVQELKEGDPVKMAGVRIGSVKAIELADGQVKVTMKVEPDAQIKTDSIATIEFLGLMGQNVVSIGFGSPDAVPIEEGGELATTTQPDLGTVMVKLDAVASGVQNLTKSFTGDTINNLLGPLTDFVRNNSTNLSLSIENLRTISDQIAQGSGTVGRLINEDELYVSALGAVTNLNSTSMDIQGVVTQAQSILGRVDAGEGTLGLLTRDETLYRETTDAMTNLREIFQKINQGEGSAGKLVNDVSFYNNARLTLQKVDKATEGLEDQGPLSVLGIAVGNLF